MDEFPSRLQEIDRPALKAFLKDAVSPVYESQLLKIAFPAMDIMAATPLALYHHHFLLFYLLYHFQEEFNQENQYLAVHFMRTVLRSFPPATECRFFNVEQGKFCRLPCLTGQQYCEHHLKDPDEMALESLSVKYFYLDRRNYDQFDELSAHAFFEGAWELLTNQVAYQKCFSTLEMPENWDEKVIKKQFRRLACLHHPDHGAQNSAKFMEINRAYRTLMKFLEMFPR